MLLSFHLKVIFFFFFFFGGGGNLLHLDNHLCVGIRTRAEYSSV